MTHNETFQWHPKARAFAAGLEIMRNKDLAPATQFQEIPTQDNYTALTTLTTCLQTGTSFCMSASTERKLPPAASGYFYTMTGGSSGQPKIINRTQASWVRSFLINKNLFEYCGKDQIAVFGELSHSLALYGVLEGLHLGHDVHVLADMKPASQRAALRRERVTILYATPTQLRLLSMGHRDVMPDVRLILCGGGSLNTKTSQQIKALCPDADIRIFYGAAETSFISLAGADAPDGSVGRAYPDVTIELRGAQNEIWVKSPYLFANYVGAEEIVEHDNDGFVTVGELGEFGEDNALRILGRKSRTLTIADQTVYLDQVEALVLTHEKATACAVLARPDVRRGHHLVAFVECETPAPTPSDIQLVCKAKSASFAVPKIVYLIDNLPLLPSGKTDYITLEKWAEERV